MDVFSFKKLRLGKPSMIHLHMHRTKTTRVKGRLKHDQSLKTHTRVKLESVQS